MLDGDYEFKIFIPSYTILANFCIETNWPYGGRFRAFLGYFSFISQLLLNYFPDISRLFPISHLFLTYFLFISQLFLASQ